jgi:CBS-domain-containing membrane protein
MKVLEKPLPLVTAEELMSQDVLTVPARMSLHGAAQMLMRARVTGAPVVDDRGQCVGVISTTDFLKLAGGVPEHGPFGSNLACDWQVLELDSVPEDTVEIAMTPDPVMVRRDALLGELARRMLDAHIHRVVVVDENRRPVGIVSTTDVLAAVAQFASTESMSQ